jgi:hypothetical protein
MADGTSKPIAQVQTNDVVRCGPRLENLAEVNAVFTLVSSQLREISLADAAGNAQPGLLATDEHLFWVDGKGWTAVANLQPGEWLFDSAGSRVQVTRTVRVSGNRRVYTLSLSGDNAFYANNVLVRDACGIVPPVARVKLSEVVQ